MANKIVNKPIKCPNCDNEYYSLSFRNEKCPKCHKTFFVYDGYLNKKKDEEEEKKHPTQNVGFYLKKE